LWTGKKPTLSYLKVFGTVAYMLDKQPGRGKFHPKSKKYIFIEYEPQTKGYRLWCPAERKTYKSRDVRFLDKFEEDNQYEDFVEQECAKNQKIEINLLQVPPTAEPESSPKFENKPEVPEMVVPRPQTPASRTQLPALVTTPRRGRGRPKKRQITMEESAPEDVLGENSAFLSEQSDPKDATEALSCTDSEEWKAAMLQEYHLPRPTNAEIIKTKWVVAKGFAQTPGVSYGEIFAPVARMSSIRMLRALSVELGMQI